MTSVPTLLTCVPLVMPPDSTVSWLPLLRTTPVLVWPDDTATTPLLTAPVTVQPSAAMLTMSAEVSAFMTPGLLLSLKASKPACESQSARSPVLPVAKLFQPSSEVTPPSIEK